MSILSDNYLPPSYHQIIYVYFLRLPHIFIYSVLSTALTYLMQSLALSIASISIENILIVLLTELVINYSSPGNFSAKINV